MSYAVIKQPKSFEYKASEEEEERRKEKKKKREQPGKPKKNKDKIEKIWKKKGEKRRRTFPS